jgi:hypothetical protein
LFGGIDFAYFIDMFQLSAIICNYLQLSANPMPFFRNGIKRLDFQKKSVRPKS